jgi:methanogenic corrinoid protein MtbC1
MLQDYPNHTFSPEKPELAISFKTGMKLTIRKFVMTSEGMDFLSNHVLGFQVQMGKVTYPKKMFVSYISPTQKNAQVAEVNEVYTSEEKNNTVVSIVNSNDLQDYSITMVYDIQPVLTPYKLDRFIKRV